MTERHMPGSHKIFVFGSNEAGIHGAGAARYAHAYCGAIWGRGYGMQGKSFGIPTKDQNIITLPITKVRDYVVSFLLFAQAHPEMEFYVSAIGTGYAHYKPEQIAPLFKTAPANVELPQIFRRVLDDIERSLPHNDQGLQQGDNDRPAGSNEDPSDGGNLQ